MARIWRHVDEAGDTETLSNNSNGGKYEREKLVELRPLPE